MSANEALISTMIMQVGSSTASAVSSYQQGRAQEKMYEEQAKIAEQEAISEAARKKKEFERFNAQQKLLYFSRGVSMGGSPNMVIDQNIVDQNQEIRAILSAGANQSRYFSMKGSIAKAEGRAKLIGGIFSGVTQAVGTYAYGKSMGYFNKTPKTTPTSIPKPKPMKDQSLTTQHPNMAIV